MTRSIAHKIYPGELEDMEKLRARLGGCGQMLPLPALHELWEEYSANLSASWLTVDPCLMDGFAGWLAHTLLWERGKREREPFVAAWRG